VPAEYGIRADHEKKAAAANARKAARKKGGRKRKQKPTSSAEIDLESGTTQIDAGCAENDGLHQEENQLGCALQAGPPQTPQGRGNGTVSRLDGDEREEDRFNQNGLRHRHERDGSAHSESTADASSLHVVNMATIQLLHERGWNHPGPPINGPGDGSPRYAVSGSVLNILHEEQQIEREERSILQGQRKKRKALHDLFPKNSKRPRKSQAERLQEDTARYFERSTLPMRSSNQKATRSTRRR
ncbi:hypothetical protein C0992_006443, partial [Termitomyces sp. T32_za158]